MKGVFVISLCLIAAGSQLNAQSESAALSGSVLDPGGNAIPNAKISAKGESSGATRNAVTSADGHFSISLAPGAYTIDVSAAGFTPEHRTGVQVTGAAAQELSISLSVANVSQTVTVEAEASVAAQLSPSRHLSKSTPPCRRSVPNSSTISSPR
jgi:hypothetical protein